MQNDLWTKGLVVGIIMLFIVTSIILPTNLVVASPNLNGKWSGILIQYPSWQFQYNLTIRQSGNIIEGESRTQTGIYYAIIAISGTISGNNVTYNETTIIEQTHPWNWYWALASYSLVLNTTVTPYTLNGTWVQINSSLSGTAFLTFTHSNNPPNTPVTPSGSTLLNVNQSSTYRTRTIDPDGDQVQYKFDFNASGSHDYSNWTNLVPSGISANISHSWIIAGTYMVKAQARDEYGAISSWSDGLTVVVNGGIQPPNAFISPSNATTSIGGTATYSITVNNFADTLDNITLTIDGLNQSWCFLSKNQLIMLPGETTTVQLNINVPENPKNVGFYPFNVIVTSLSGQKNVSATLSILLNPIMNDLEPVDNVTIASTDLPISWKTSVQASSEVYIKKSGDIAFNHIVGEYGSEHSVFVYNLSRNADYILYAFSQASYGNTSSDLRTLHVSNGISFSKDVYVFNVQRDYAQHASASVINSDTQPHDLLLEALNSYQDLIVGFVGPGSVDENVTLAPGETRSVDFNIFAQDAMQQNYTFTIKLTNLGAEQITDYALVTIHVQQPNINIKLTEVSIDSTTLSKTIVATNYGDTITDFCIDTGGNLTGRVYFQPTVYHANFLTGESLMFKAVPVLTVNFTGFNGVILATGAGQTVASLPVNFTLSIGKSIFAVTIPLVSIKFSTYYDTDNSPNTNPLPNQRVETYLVNGKLVFASQIIVDVYQNSTPASDANVSLTVWNETGAIQSMEYSQTDFTGKAMFVVFGKAGNYSYQAGLVGYGMTTDKRNFSTDNNQLFSLHPSAISWLNVSDGNSTYDLSQNISRVILDKAPFIFRGKKATIENNTTTTLFLKWDEDPYKKIQIRGTIENNTFVFHTSAIPPGNFSALIFSYSPSFGLSYSVPVNITCLDQSAMYTQGNYTYQLPFPLNATHIIQLNIEHTVKRRDSKVTFDLYNVEPANSDTQYSLVYLALSNETITKNFHIEAGTTEGEVYNNTTSVKISANTPSFINLTLPVRYQNGSLITELHAILTVDNCSLTVVIRPHVRYFYDLRIWVGSDNGLWDYIMHYNPDPYGTIGTAISCGIGSNLFLFSYEATGMARVGWAGANLFFDTTEMLAKYQSPLDYSDYLTVADWSTFGLTTLNQLANEPRITDLGSWSDAAGNIFGVATIANCIYDYSKAMGRWWNDAQHINPFGIIQTFWTLLWYCPNNPHVGATFCIASPSDPSNSPVNGIQKAFVTIRFTLPWDRNLYRPHDVSILLNNQPIGHLSNVIPEGHYVFEVDPSALNFASSGTASNTIILSTHHLNYGHFIVVSDVTITVVYKPINILIVASNQQDANNLAVNMTKTLLANLPDPAVFPEDFHIKATVHKGVQNMNVTIWNLGATFAYNLPIRICDGNMTIADFLAFIPPFHNITLPVIWNATVGSHTIQTIVDPDNLLHELSKINNQAQKSITVLAIDSNPPVFGTPSPINGSKGNLLSLSWSIPINDSEGNLFSWTIQCSNGQTNSGTGGANGTKSLSLSGLAYSTIYKVWVNATDPNGSGLFTKKWYTFTTEINYPPAIPSIPSGPTFLNIEQAGTFSTNTIDPDSDQVQYKFDFNASGSHDYSNWTNLLPSGTSINTSYAWITAGTYVVKAQARDEHGAESNWSDGLTITINGSINQPPNKPETPTGPTTREIGQNGTYCTNTTDPDGDQIQYRFDWDATGSHNYSNWTELMNSGQAVNIIHSWNIPGTYIVQAQARDVHGAESNWTKGLTVIVSVNQPPNKPVIPMGPTTRVTDQNGTYYVNTTDPDGDQIQFRFDWNASGSHDYSDWIGIFDSRQTCFENHSWISPGTYVVQAQARDEHGAESNWSDGLTIVVGRNNPPVFRAPSPANDSTGNPVSVRWGIPINDPQGDLISWAIQCSNGQTNSGTGEVNGTKSLSLYGLTYSTAYKIWVNATDPTGSDLWTRRWYTFTTKANLPPVFGTPNPANRSTTNPRSFTWSIPINDPEGNAFTWTIQCSNGQKNSGTGASNGTKLLSLSGLAYSKTYKVWVNATDPTGSTLYTRRWYTFTTQQSGIEILDQLQTKYTSNYAVYLARWGGQSFKPTKGLLTSVNIYMRKIGCPPHSVTLSVRRTISGSDLVKLSKPASQIPTSYGWVKFDFSDLTVTPGSRYYLVVRTSGGSSTNCYYWGYGSSTPYMNGALWYSYDGGSTWKSSTYDFCFKTYGL